MSATEQMDRIVHDALKDMLALTDSDEINNRVAEASKALDNLIITPDERNYLTESKNKLTNLQFDIGVAWRADALAQLNELTIKIAAAEAQMDADAADNLLT